LPENSSPPLRHPLELAQKGTDLLVVGQSPGHEFLGFLVLPQRREQVLLLEPGQELQLLLELREQPLPGPHRAIAGLGKLGEEFVRLGRTAVNQLPDRH
jgi:hypothetical protein